MTTTISTSSVASTFILLAGPSDVEALRALMKTAGIGDASIEIVNLQGMTNVGRTLREIRQIRSDADVVGLCDAGEARFAQKALVDDGLPVTDASDLPVYGFFVCEPDLASELIRALGADEARAALVGAGLAGSLDALRTQPEWADRPLADQVHRFCVAPSGRKQHAAAVLAGALPAQDVPEPLTMLLDRIRWA